MSAYSFDELIQRVLTVGILSPPQIDELRAEIRVKNPSADLFLQSAMRHGWMTNYQIDRINSGDDRGFFFGLYKALYVAGAGTFARVFRCVHRETNETAAVKVLRARFSDSEAFINHFMTEARLVSELKHPNIVPVFHAESIGHLHYMAMEFVEGQTLREFIKIRKKVEPKTVIQIGLDACSALEYALRVKKLPHRDLKLSNIILSSSGQAKLVDFGLASVAQDKAGADIPFLRHQQSIDYIALEKASGAPRMDDRSDLYFLGCILYHLLCGESPFLETKDKAKRMDRNRFFTIKPIQQVEPDLPAAVAALINKALMPNAEHRYQTAGEMLGDLRNAMRRLDSGTSGTADSPSLRIGQKTDRAERLKQIQTKTVLIVDANPKTQESLKILMEKFQLHTICINNPDEVAPLFASDDLAAQCILFNGQSLGMRAVRAFNDFSQYRGLRDVGAVLILDAGQIEWENAVTLQPNRVILTMPVKVRQVREALQQMELLPEA
ncbi:MAG: serine/threonine protein kinase [Planctomycetaceae bacterium]|jgi:serine/threonine-protein kinase|nr:serine/threonine protein kinase [Planctomycetaceae bacterium]